MGSFARTLAPRAPTMDKQPKDTARPPRDDESYVLATFSSHYQACKICSLSNRELCPEGNACAVDLASYVFNKHGVPYSTTDNARLVEINFPPHCDASKRLLKMVENGLSLGNSKPKSFDESYYVAPRPVNGEASDGKKDRKVSFAREARVAEFDKHEPCHVDARVDTRPGGRGSLYDADMLERERLHKEDSVQYRVTSYSEGRYRDSHYRM